MDLIDFTVYKKKPTKLQKSCSITSNLSCSYMADIIPVIGLSVIYEESFCAKSQKVNLKCFHEE